MSPLRYRIFTPVRYPSTEERGLPDAHCQSSAGKGMPDRAATSSEPDKRALISINRGRPFASWCETRLRCSPPGPGGTSAKAADSSSTGMDMLSRTTDTPPRTGIVR